MSAGVEAVLWRSIAVFRVVACAYAGILIISGHGGYRHPLGGFAVLAVMAGWTAVAARVRGGTVFGLADLAVSVSCLLATGLVETRADLASGTPNLTVSWVAAPVMAWALRGGVGHGVAAAVAVAVPDVALRAGYAGVFTQTTFNGIVLLLMVGVIVGSLGTLALAAERRMARAVAMETATRERERLARDIHDSVLQILALVQRRGGELGGEAAELGRLAGEQEAALRALISGPSDPPSVPGLPGASSALDGDEVDLRTLLTRRASATVQLATPATPVPLPATAARELAAAVGAALDNVAAHCPPGTRAWVLVEDDGAAVTVSVRDEGPGMPAGRLAQAAEDGRLGVAQSVRGRVRDLGGTVEIVSAPGQGTEIELTVPR
ncbi:MacS family sensor histidine kinase [Actinocorallia aurea]